MVHDSIVTVVLPGNRDGDEFPFDAGETGWASHEVAIKLVVSFQRGWVEAMDPQDVVHTPEGSR